MLGFSRILAALVALVFAVPATALASSGSLLSGYSRPGGGEQQQLGPGLLPPKHGNGGLRAPAQAAAPSTPVTPATPTPAPTATSTAARPAPVHHHTATTPAPTHTTPAQTVVPGPATSVTPHVALPAVVYPDAATHAGAGFPLSGSPLLLVLLACLGLAAIALATRRTSEPSG